MYVCMLCMYAMYVFYVCILCMYSMYVFYVCILCMHSMYVSYVCALCMYFMYVFYLCILCMYSTNEFRIFVCKASWLSRHPGAKIHEKQHLRIQEGHFLKSALNLDLTPSEDGKCPALLKSSGIIDLGAFCVELWSFYVSKRISAPMSYISF